MRKTKLLAISQHLYPTQTRSRTIPANMSTSAVERANEFVSFLNASPTPFHAVKNASALLEKAGFKLIKVRRVVYHSSPSRLLTNHQERDSWSSSLKNGGKYYLTRNGSTLAAFAIGKQWKAGNPLAMIGTHTDSPVLRIKPNSKKTGEGFLQARLAILEQGRNLMRDRSVSKHTVAVCGIPGSIET